MKRHSRILSFPATALAGRRLFAAAPAQGYVQLVSYNNLWQYGSYVPAYLASVVDFDNWCWSPPGSWDCLEWYTAAVDGELKRDGGTVVRNQRLPAPRQADAGESRNAEQRHVHFDWRGTPCPWYP
ncbi:MAG: hypothetical protein IT159_16270 [Bryobacterales bacterium]|nr:hypothetical protein [Bryobacterales bacterium]